MQNPRTVLESSKSIEVRSGLESLPLGDLDLPLLDDFGGGVDSEFISEPVPSADGLRLDRVDTEPGGDTEDGDGAADAESVDMGDETDMETVDGVAGAGGGAPVAALVRSTAGSPAAPSPAGLDIVWAITLSRSESTPSVMRSADIEEAAVLNL
jgi:hypothetical protein